MAKKPEEVIEETTQSTAVVSWEDKLAQYAVQAAEEESNLGGKFLSLKAGRLTLDGVPCAQNKLDVIVTAHTTEFAYYEGKYDPGNPKPPVCYAFGVDEQTMAPHEKASKPQNDNCFHCPKNQWGSDPEGGKGKACKNTRRLALIPADTVNDPEKIMAAEEIYVKLPVMSVKNWAKYVNDVAAQFRRPPFGVITTLSTEPDAKSQFKVTFNFKDKVPDNAIGQMVERHEASAKSVGFPYPTASDEAPVKESGKY